MTTENLLASAEATRRRAWLEIGAGLVLVLVGLAITFLTTRGSVASWIANILPSAGGLALALVGVWRLSSYRMFVAWRYLLHNPPRVKAWVGILILFLFMARAFMGLFMDVPVETIDMKNPKHSIANLIKVATLVLVVVYLLRHSKPALYTFIGA